jgi:hypothetical protein
MMPTACRHRPALQPLRTIEQRRPRVSAALDTLSAADLGDRSDAWR